MKRAVLLLLVGAVLFGSLSLFAAAAAGPKEVKPVALLSVASYDELMGDIAYVGKISDNPDLAVGLEAMLKLFTKSRGLEGLDKTRPLGVVLQTDGTEMFGYGMIPVTDLEKLLDVLRPFTKGIDVQDDGVFKITTDDKPLYVVEKDGWALASDRVDVVKQQQPSPTETLERLSAQYDLALQIQGRNVPASVRGKIVADMRRDSQKDMKRRDGESEEEHAVRVKVTTQIVDVLVSLVEDVDEVTLGWTLDHQQEKTFAEVTVTAKPDTPTAKLVADLDATKSRFAGFLLPEATISGNWAGTMPEVKKNVLKTILSAVRKQAMANIAKEDKSEEEKKVARQVAGDVIDVVQKTVENGQVDGGMAVVAAPESLTVLAGGYVADSAQLEKLARQLAAIASSENPLISRWIQFDAGECEGVRLHTVSVPIPEDAKDREKVVSLIGETLDVVVGIGKDSLYVAAGRDAMKTLRQAIQRSAAEAYRSVPPVRFSLAVKSVAEFIAAVGEEKDRPQAQKLAQWLQDQAGADRIELVVTPVERGVRYRVEFDKGILRALGQMSLQAGNAQ